MFQIEILGHLIEAAQEMVISLLGKMIGVKSIYILSFQLGEYDKKVARQV